MFIKLVTRQNELSNTCLYFITAEGHKICRPEDDFTSLPGTNMWRGIPRCDQVCGRPGTCGSSQQRYMHKWPHCRSHSI